MLSTAEMEPSFWSWSRTYPCLVLSHTSIILRLRMIYGSFISIVITCFLIVFAITLQLRIMVFLYSCLVSWIYEERNHCNICFLHLVRICCANLNTVARHYIVLTVEKKMIYANSLLQPQHQWMGIHGLPWVFRFFMVFALTIRNATQFRFVSLYLCFWSKWSLL
jgi:hypothetical protein